MAPEELSITRVTERLGSERWAPVTRWTSYRTIYLYKKIGWRNEEKWYINKRFRVDLE